MNLRIFTNSNSMILEITLKKVIMNIMKIHSNTGSNFLRKIKKSSMQFQKNKQNATVS